jgi:hypothetical protein
MRKKVESDFGQGFIYNLILFAKHFGQIGEFLKMLNNVNILSKERNKLQKKNKKVSSSFPKLLLTEKRRENVCACMWFNSASDHLYDLKIPKQWANKKLGKKANELCSFALSIGHGSRMMDKTVSFKDVEKVISLTKEIGLLIDKELGIKTIVAKYS